MVGVDTMQYNTTFYALFGLETQNLRLQTRDEKKNSFGKNRKFSRFFAKKYDFSIFENLCMTLVVGVDSMQCNVTFYVLFGLET